MIIIVVGSGLNYSFRFFLNYLNGAKIGKLKPRKVGEGKVKYFCCFAGALVLRQGLAILFWLS